MMVSMLTPMLETSAVTLSLAPRPSVTSAMTAATPMTMPSMVSTERSVLRRISRMAMSTVLPSIIRNGLIRARSDVRRARPCRHGS
jgi:hypothetical protein